jgi:excisionase family DNA binding protein
MATKWLSVTEAARRLRVSESTVWRLLRTSTLTSVKLRGRRMVAGTAVQALMREMTAPPGAAEVRPFALDDPLLRLAGKFRSRRRGPGSSDKHRYLEERS